MLAVMPYQVLDPNLLSFPKVPSRVQGVFITLQNIVLIKIYLTDFHVRYQCYFVVALKLGRRHRALPEQEN